MLEVVKIRMSKLSEGGKPLHFACLVLVCTAITWFVYFITHGSAFFGYYVFDTSNTSMDYFNMLANIYTLDPYANNANYPAMCFLVWRFLYHFMPGIPQGGDGLFLRDYMLAQLPYMLYTMACILLICLCVRYLLRSLKTGTVNLVVAALMVSGPMIFTLERGNIILLALASLMLFVCFYDSSKKSARYFSYICLAVSAAIKIYPAVFALLVFAKGRHKESIHLVIICIGVFVAPFFAFDGFASVKTMLGGIFLSSEMNESIGLGLNFGFSNLIKIVVSLSGIKLQSVPFIFTIVPFVVCILLFFVCKAVWKRLFLLSLMCIWIPSFSYTYVLIFFIPAVVLFLKESTHEKLDSVYLALFVLIFIPYAFPEVSMVSTVWEGSRFALSWGCLIVNAVLVAFPILFIGESVGDLKRRFRMLR